MRSLHLSIVLQLSRGRCICAVFDPTSALLFDLTHLSVGGILLEHRNDSSAPTDLRLSIHHNCDFAAPSSVISLHHGTHLHPTAFLHLLLLGPRVADPSFFMLDVWVQDEGFTSWVDELAELVGLLYLAHEDSFFSSPNFHVVWPRDDRLSHVVGLREDHLSLTTSQAEEESQCWNHHHFYST